MGHEMNPAIENIWKEFAPQLGRFIRTRVETRESAEDILQDVFVKLQNQLDEFRDPMKFRGWLFLVARNAIIDHYRKRKMTSELTEWLPAEISEHETEAKELKAVFHRLLYSLPEPYRDALVLTEFDGLTQEQLAKRLGISISGAKSRVQRGREQLKELLIDYCHREFSRAIGSQPCPKGLMPTVQDTQSDSKHTRKPPRVRRKSKK
jgi:RNA polymerase sigma-70 factor (ECF subfamily)